MSGGWADRCPGIDRLPYTCFMDDTEAKLLWLLEEVRSRRMGYGKAAELAGIPLAQFLSLMGQHHITPFDYGADELARELSPRP